MANIVIKDLTESADLDRQAMRAIVGGARSGGRRTVQGSAIWRSNRIFSYPGGIGSDKLTGSGGLAAGSSLRK